MRIHTVQTRQTLTVWFGTTYRERRRGRGFIQASVAVHVQDASNNVIHLLVALQRSLTS